MGSTQAKRELSQKEYWAFKQMVGALNTLVNNEEILESRVRLVDKGWRDFKMVRTVLMKLYKNIWVQTLPKGQQERLREEFKNTHTYIDVKRPQDNGYRSEFCFMPVKNMERIMTRIMKQECTFCMKCGKEVSRCSLKQDIEATYEWEIAKKMPDGTCPFAALVKEEIKDV